MQDLLGAGLIQPMAVLCLANDQVFGGYFYGNSDPAGMYDSIFHYDEAENPTRNLIGWFHDYVPMTIRQPSKRGIGGVGEGAYGALRAVMINPGVFSSVSVADGPLDFDGPGGNGGLMRLFDASIAEQEANYALNPEVDIIINGNDTIYDTLPFSFQNHFDSSQAMPVSRMFIGGSLAFSPNDTLIDYTRPPTPPNSNFTVDIHARYQLTDSLPNDGSGEWKTFISHIIKGDSQARNVPDGMDFHLPFDGNGDVFSPIWSLWMRNNLDSLHQRAIGIGDDPLDGMNLFVASNPGAGNYFYEMTQSWLDYLDVRDVPYEEYKYSGMGGGTVEGDEYLFDILREMLIFHSDSFGD
jgi:hypothetical protein